MSLIFDPRASALAAYMMNPLLCDANSVSTLQNSNKCNILQTMQNSTSNDVCKIQEFLNHHNHENNTLNDNQAAIAAVAAATAAAEQQTAALNFAAQLAAAMSSNNHSANPNNVKLHSNNSNKNFQPKSLSELNSLSTNQNNASGSFRILDLLDATASDNAETLLQNFTSKALSQTEKHCNNRIQNINNNSDDVINLHLKRGTKRSFDERQSILLLDADDEDDIDDSNEQKAERIKNANDSISPRSCSSPNGSLNGSLLSMATASNGENHNGLNGSSKKARKARTIFTDKQLHELETMFEKHKYLSVQDRMDLAQRMGLSDTQVKTWYQNRRTKWKRQAAVGMDLLQESSSIAAVQNLLRTNPYWSQYLLSNPYFAQQIFPNIGTIHANAASSINPALLTNFPAFLPQNVSNALRHQFLSANNSKIASSLQKNICVAESSQINKNNCSSPDEINLLPYTSLNLNHSQSNSKLSVDQSPISQKTPSPINLNDKKLTSNFTPPRDQNLEINKLYQKNSLLSNNIEKNDSVTFNHSDNK